MLVKSLKTLRENELALDSSKVVIDRIFLDGVCEGYLQHDIEPEIVVSDSEDEGLHIKQKMSLLDLREVYEKGVERTDKLGEFSLPAPPVPVATSPSAAPVTIDGKNIKTQFPKIVRVFNSLFLKSKREANFVTN